MQNAITQFRSNIESIRELDALCDILERQTSPVVDFSEILRSEVVLAVSAMDCFVHDVVRIGMVDIFKHSGTESRAFKNFHISMECLKRILSLADVEQQCDVLSNEIRRINGYKSFQEPEKISQALSVLGLRHVWDRIGRITGQSASEIQERLTLIIQQRHRIVHEADIDPTFGPGRKFPIDRHSTKNTVDFIKKVCESLFQLLVSTSSPI